MNLLQQIQLHREGKTFTIPFRHPKLSKDIFIGRKMYHLIGGAGGSGKSSYVDDNYILEPYYWFKQQLIENPDFDFQLRIYLRSMERSKEHRIAKWVCLLLYNRYGVLLDTKTLLGWGMKKSVITDELYEIICKLYDEIEAMSDIITVIDGSENPTGISIHAEKEAEKVGTTFFYGIEKSTGLKKLFKRRNGLVKLADQSECPDVTPYQPVYVPDTIKKITLYIIDNLQTTKNEKNYSDKQKFDKLSEYTRTMRDLYHYSPVMVSQLNRGVNDTTRKVKTELLPQRSDFSGSDQPYSDCDMAAILFNPYDYGLDNLRGWQIKQCVNAEGLNRFRSFHLLKNTYGADNQIYGFQFIGEIGRYKELPHPDNMEISTYHAVANPNYKHKLTGK
jgi:hypothetical protein